MYFFEKTKIEIAKSINQALKKQLVKPSELVTPANPDFGDLSLSCFVVGKAIGKTPIEAASILVGKVKADGLIAGARAVGPYLNITLNKEKVFKGVLSEVDKMKKMYGINKNGKAKKVMIEYSNANTHKEYHVGHLRNICFGDAVHRILAANGFKTLPVSYINDFGIHVAKTLWWTFHNDNVCAKEVLNENKIDNKGYFLGKMYVESTRKISEFSNGKEEVGEVMKKIESRKGEMYKLWQKTRKWSIDYFDVIYKELGIKFVHIFYESEFIDKGRDLVVDLYEKRVLEKSQGAIIANLEKYNLGVLMFLRTDGTALYPVADLPLAIEKFKKFKLDKSIYVVDIRQGLYFKQLFKVLEILKIKKEMVHLEYDFVKLPSGMMSSRTGNVITYEELSREILEKSKAETKQRHEEWPDKKIEQVAKVITNGAMKFEMIKISANQVITFDVNQALQFEGYTAAYIQYTCARINSIIRKSKATVASLPNNQMEDQLPGENLIVDEGAMKNKEHLLTLKLAKYPEAVAKSGEDYDPSVLAKYLFDLSRLFNDYYHSVPVLKADIKTRNMRLKQITAVKQTITNGLNLLGIDILEEM